MPCDHPFELLSLPAIHVNNPVTARVSIQRVVHRIIQFYMCQVRHPGVHSSTPSQPRNRQPGPTGEGESKPHEIC